MSCIFLTNLAIIDVTLTTVIVPVRIVEIFVVKFYIRHGWTCKLFYTLREALYICYILTFMLIAMERYIVVIHPMKAISFWTKGKARLSLGLVWILALILAIPTWFQRTLLGNFGNDDDFPICVGDIPRRLYPHLNVELWRKLHESYSLFILFVVPCFSLIIIYGFVANALYQSIRVSRILTQNQQRPYIRESNEKNKGTQSPQLVIEDRQQKLRRRSTQKATEVQKERVLVLKMCILLATFFTICQGPWRILDWIRVVVVQYVDSNIIDKLEAPLFALAVLNSAINPIVYGFMSRNFRRAFVVTIAKWCIVPISVYRRSVTSWYSWRASESTSDNRRSSAGVSVVSSAVTGDTSPRSRLSSSAAMITHKEKRFKKHGEPTMEAIDRGTLVKDKSTRLQLPEFNRPRIPTF